MHGITKCPCGFTGCDKHHIDALGTYYQGSGHDLPTAQKLAAIDDLLNFVRKCEMSVDAPLFLRKAANNILWAISDATIRKV